MLNHVKTLWGGKFPGFSYSSSLFKYFSLSLLSIFISSLSLNIFLSLSYLCLFPQINFPVSAILLIFSLSFPKHLVIYINHLSPFSKHISPSLLSLLFSLSYPKYLSMHLSSILSPLVMFIISFCFVFVISFDLLS